MRAPGHFRSERGYSLIETLVVAALAMVLMAMTVVQIRASRATFAADNAMRHVMGEMARARDMAIQQRRIMLIQLLPTNELRIVRVNPNTNLPEPDPLRRTILEGNIGFALPPGTPDTPDAFGAASAWDFDGANPTTEVAFNGDGMMINRTSGNVINGTVFLAAPNDPYATRAVTVLGATGRVRGFRRMNVTWGRV